MAILSETLSNFASGPMLRILGALLILALGHLSIKLGLKAVRKYTTEKATVKELRQHEDRIKLVSNTLDAIVVVVALAYLNVGISSQLQQTLVQNAPNVLSAILIGFLGVITINIAENVFKDFFQTLGLKKYVREAGISSASFNVLSTGIKGFLYLVLVQILLYQLQLNIALVNQLLNAFVWAFALLAAGLVFYSLKDLFQNLGAGLYLKNSRVIRPGEEVKLDDETGEIREVSLFGTTLETKDGYTSLTPNRKVLDSGIKFKKSKNDLETLQEINSYFKSSEDENTAATAQLALEIFENYYSRDDIIDKLEGEEPEDVQKLVEDASEGEIKTAFIEADKVSDLGTEFKSWFNDGALIISKLDKSGLFMDAEDDYTLSVAVESGEVLNIDTRRGSENGVYYVAGNRMKELMSGEDGYIVLAREGTNAHWRLKNDLIYSEKEEYEDLSKTLENRLRKIMRQGRVLTDVMPVSVRGYIEKWSREKDEFSREWGVNREDTSGSSKNQ
ncbi:mechanosensitive ion channel domain-containing protein [Candidatus Nanohalobium constans]|uniref:Small conductance mechanosensitive channel n=1 Tax=Candidatus Nanohalobium constans TaxID=2565781 RepID=A0A5Q0UGA0_9ARCH|nr:mechanosensitive ion channel domain-containing protein [Candidatus Nanohalobium constans]QGA80672.1 small conductance mechanosensitive channel [Candidatus Nanohalobium constans]